MYLTDSSTSTKPSISINPKASSISPEEAAPKSSTGPKQTNYSEFLLKKQVSIPRPDGGFLKKEIKVALPLPRAYFGPPVPGAIRPAPVSRPVPVPVSLAEKSETEVTILATSIKELSTKCDDEKAKEEVSIIIEESKEQEIAIIPDNSPYAGMTSFRRRAFEQLDALQEHRGKSTTRYLAIDVEKLTWADRGISEVGVTTWEGGALVDKKFGKDAKFFHYKSRERLYKHNKKSFGGKNFNHKDDFFGTSIVDNLPGIGKRVMSKVNGMKKVGTVFIVVHGGSNDLDDLASIGCSFEGCIVLDTQDLYRAINNDNSQIGLSSLVSGEPSTDKPFHNAGNDAFYTMWGLAKMMERLDRRAARAAAASIQVVQ